jgi:lipid-A-disaccharide synthase
MLIAGEASGDLLAAELVSALRGKLPDATFFGAGGAKMAAAGVELAFDLTQHSVIGISDVLKKYFEFRRLFHQLLALAIERKPDVVIGVDYGGFNLRFGHAVKEYVRNNPFSKWNPKIVQFVSPQVWASRPGRANLLAADYDLLLSIFPFEKDWYAQRVPNLRVEFVGHPMVERMQKSELRIQNKNSVPAVLLLPGSRRSELKKHLRPMLRAAKQLSAGRTLQFCVVLPDGKLLKELARGLMSLWPTLQTPIIPLFREPAFADENQFINYWSKTTRTLAEHALPNLEIQIGNLPQALAEADVAIASTGTVTMECAFFGVPTVTLYKTSWLTYQIARRIITVKSLTMPNLLAGEQVYPEFVQHDATPENLSRATLELLQDESRRTKIKSQLAKIISSLGEPGAAGRAAEAVLNLFK